MVQPKALTSDELAQQRTDLAEERTEMAVSRTQMAADRSLMAWIRTGLSMISFGFTIYKVLHALQQAGASLPRDNTPRNVGLFLTGLGTVSIVIGTIDYVQTLKGLQLQHARVWRPAFIVALIMSGAGLLLFALIVSKAV